MRYLFLLFISFAIVSQFLPAEVRAQQKYLEHKVQRKETFYFLSQKYGVTIEEIKAANPGLKQLKNGQKIRIPQIVSSSGKPMGGSIQHTIAPGETLYSVSRKYGMTIQQIVDANPGSDKSFTIGKVLNIPGSVPAPGTLGEGRKGVYHIVVRGETLFGLSQTYDVPMSEIILANPKLDKNPVKAGDTLFIATSKVTEPIRKNGAGDIAKEQGKSPDSATDKATRCNPVRENRGPNNPVRVALLLPLMIEGNLRLNSDFLSAGAMRHSEDDALPSDSTGLKQGMIQFQGSSENFIHFYEGVLLAIDSLKERGTVVELDVFDTEQKASRVKSLVSSGKLEQADLIIGPVYPNEQKEITDYAFKKQIPLISPLSGSDEITRNNPFFFQVNPTREYIEEKTVEYIVSAFKGSNVIVIMNGSQGNDAETLHSQLQKESASSGPNGHGTQVLLCDYRKKGFSGMKEMLVKGRKNIIVIQSSNEPDVSSVVSNIKYLTPDYDITLLGTNRFPQFESINPDLYHQAQLEFLTPYWADFQANVTRSFVLKFRDYFKQEPNQFSMQGYDVTFFFVKALANFGNDFRGCISYANSTLVQGTYHFSKHNSGGYINGGLSVIQYTPGYEILRKKVISK